MAIILNCYKFSGNEYGYKDSSGIVTFNPLLLLIPILSTLWIISYSWLETSEERQQTADNWQRRIWFCSTIRQLTLKPSGLVWGATGVRLVCVKPKIHFSSWRALLWNHALTLIHFRNSIFLCSRPKAWTRHS